VTSAREGSPSLARALRAVEEFQPVWPRENE
jgi:hypothetical protein